MDSPKPLATRPPSYLRRRLTTVERRLEAKPDDIDLLQERLDLRAEMRRRRRAIEANGSDDETKALKAEARADQALRRWIMANAPIDTSQMVFDGIDTTMLPDGREAPTFSVLEVAKCFFGRSSHWIRWREREGHLVLNGHSVGEGRTKTGSRFYTLADIERIAHALAERQAIDPTQLVLAVTNARNIAIMLGILDNRPEE